MHQIRFRLRLCPDFAGELTTLPQVQYLDSRCLTSKGRGKIKGKWERGGKGKEKGEEKKKRQRRGKGDIPPWLKPRSATVCIGYLFCAGENLVSESSQQMETPAGSRARVFPSLHRPRPRRGYDVIGIGDSLGIFLIVSSSVDILQKFTWFYDVVGNKNFSESFFGLRSRRRGFTCCYDVIGSGYSGDSPGGAQRGCRA